jgi:hypothetical protein
LVTPSEWGSSASNCPLAPPQLGTYFQNSTLRGHYPTQEQLVHSCFIMSRHQNVEDWATKEMVCAWEKSEILTIISDCNIKYS